MDKFDELLKQCDLEFFGQGKHKISVDKALELYHENKAFVMDVRTKEELTYVKFDFAFHMPVSDVPERLEELPRDKKIVVFCSSLVRATMVYAYLKSKGYDDVQILTNDIGEIASCFKPGYVLKTKGKSL